jgi:sulfoxide reductase heme-binding subunit YedZ
MLNSNMLNDFKNAHPTLWIMGQGLFAGMVLLIGFAGTMLILSAARSPFGIFIQNLLSWLFAMNSVQAMWYITRSAGFASYLLLWFSTALGLAMPTKLFDKLLPRAFTYDFHQFISLLALGFIALHVGVLMVDRYLPYTLAQILIPFISPSRPVWVGMGVFSFYLTLLVTITFYLRSRIGMKTFKVIHYTSLLGYLGVVIHSFFSGTDSSVPAAQWMYISTFLVVVFLTSYWLIAGVFQSKRKNVPAVNQTKKMLPKQVRVR